jgi:hypothetical protein
VCGCDLKLEGLVGRLVLMGDESVDLVCTTRCHAILVEGHIQGLEEKLKSLKCLLGELQKADVAYEE